MRPKLQKAAPDGFINLVKEGIKKRQVSLNRVAERAGMSPAFLSRILNRERGLPADKAILRLASELDIQPPELLLIKAGRVPNSLSSALSRPQIPELLRATDKLSEADMQRLMETVQALVLHRRSKG